MVVIGCGPAGMMAAISAAREGASVTVLEGQKTPGRKLLMTGNSRCNLTNLAPHMETEYQSGDQKRVLPLVRSIFSQLSAGRTLDLFHQMGLLTTVEHDTYVYPVTGQSQSVLNLLLEEMRELGVRLKFSEKVTGIEKSGRDSGRGGDGAPETGRWLVRTEGWHYEADSVVLACGGKSYPQTGSDGSGFALAEGLGLKVTDTLPALTGISVLPARQPVTLESLKEEQRMLYGDGAWEAKGSGAEKTGESKAWEAEGTGAGKAEKCGSDKMEREGRRRRKEEKEFLAPLAGVRMNAGVSVFIDRIPSARDIGQLQFTATDLSGIVVFQVSRKVSRALHERKDVEIRLDLIPSFTEDEVETLLAHYAQNHPAAPLKMAFCGLLPQQLVPCILKASGTEEAVRGDSKACQMDRDFIRAVSEAIKSLRLKATGVRGFDSCQVTAGGVNLSQVDPQTLECTSDGLSGIYLAGEMLDVDGPCGGYNLQWAWSSGYAAGRSAAGGTI